MSRTTSDPRSRRGRENARVFLKEHTDVRAKIEAALRKKLGLPGTAGQVEAPANTAERQPEKAVAAASGAAAALRGKNGR